MHKDELELSSQTSGFCIILSNLALETISARFALKSISFHILFSDTPFETLMFLLNVFTSPTLLYCTTSLRLNSKKIVSLPAVFFLALQGDSH